MLNRRLVLRGALGVVAGTALTGCGSGDADTGGTVTIDFWHGQTDTALLVLEFTRHGENLYPRLDEAIEADEQLRRRVRVDMYRRLGYYPTETSEHSSEYVPWYLHHDSEIVRLRVPVGSYLDIVEENLAAYEQAHAALAAGEPLAVEGTMEYAPQIIHSMVTGTPRVV